jgi:hypothetical protein
MPAMLLLLVGNIQVAMLPLLALGRKPTVIVRLP